MGLIPHIVRACEVFCMSVPTPSVEVVDILIRLQKDGRVALSKRGEEKQTFPSLFQAMQYAGTFGPRRGFRYVLREDAGEVVLTSRHD